MEHMGRVADLLGEWAQDLGLPEQDALRWRAAGYLHDALRDADPGVIKEGLPPRFADLPDDVIHGPAAAHRLAGEGVVDEALLRAVAYHTTGHPELDELGTAVYAADFLEPGRKQLVEERRALRARMTREPESVVREVAKLRIGRLVSSELPIPSETCGFWNTLVREAHG
jgi:HD superfamily phosphohydrolase YqeK